MSDIGGVGVEPILKVLGDEVPYPERADEDHVMFVLARKTDVVRERRRHMQIDAAARRFLAQEIGLHLDIAIAEQQRINAPARTAKILQAVRRADRPVGRTALLQLAPVAIEHFRGVAPMLGGEFLSRRSQLFFRRHLGQDLA